MVSVNISYIAGNIMWFYTTWRLHANATPIHIQDRGGGGGGGGGGGQNVYKLLNLRALKISM